MCLRTLHLASSSRDWHFAEWWLDEIHISAKTVVLAKLKFIEYEGLTKVLVHTKALFSLEHTLLLLDSHAECHAEQAVTSQAAYISPAYPFAVSLCVF